VRHDRRGRGRAWRCRCRGLGMRWYAAEQWGEGRSVFIWTDIHKPVENDLNPSIRNYLLISMVKGYLSIHMAKV
jgi:hypothetical protein